jgi:hypothetical protein
MPTVFIADLFAIGVHLDAAEAVAIAQQLIGELTSEHGSRRESAEPLLGPPTPANVLLGWDGAVACLACETKPAVFEIAVFLQTLLPAATAPVPGALRYTIARGLHDVDAPPFDSIDEFSRALARFERGDRAAVVRGVLARATGQPPIHAFGRPRAVPPSIERRRTAPSAAALRRELHAVDRRLFEQRVQTPAVEAAPPAPVAAPREIVPVAVTRPHEIVPVLAAPARRWRVPAVAASLAAALTLTAVADLIYRQRSHGAEPSSLPTSIGASAGAGAATGTQIARSDAPRTGSTPDDTPLVRSERLAKESKLSATAPKARYVALPQPPADGDGALVRALDDQHRPVFSPAFASSGTAMFFHTGATRDAQSALAVAESPEGGDLGVMTIVDDGARNYHVQPSPDGRLIAFDSDRDGERGIYVARRDGTNVRRISGPGYAAVPTWAPDGRRIAYIRAEPGNPKVWNLWLQRLDEDQARPLTAYRYGQPWSASWFPDNRRVAYTHEDKLVILDVETGQKREFASPIKGRLVRTPAVSPDGSKVIFQVFRNGAWMLDVADGSMNCVLTDPTAEEFAWAPDGRRVAFHSRRDGQWGIYILHRS